MQFDDASDHMGQFVGIAFFGKGSVELKDPDPESQQGSTL
jgi:hypothetical protein